MEYIRLGKIINTHGIRGDLKIDLETDFFDERFAVGNTVYLLDDGEYRPFEVTSSRIHKGYGLVRFKGYEDINLVESYKNKELYYPMDQIEEMAKRSAECTHDHPEGIKGAVTLATCVRMAEDGCSKEDILRYGCEMYPKPTREHLLYEYIHTAVQEEDQPRYLY